MTTLSRKPIQVVEIEVPQCSLTYGAGACTASLSALNPRKCFNTFHTCQDTANFDPGDTVLRFVMQGNKLPASTFAWPALVSVSTNPTEINMGGFDDRTGPLGKRARVTITLRDFVDPDIFLDKYQAERKSGAAQFDGVGYDPSRGTFFAKLHARDPFYVGRPLRIYEGYEGESIGAMRSRRYVITERSGPDASGRVTYTAADVLDLADNKKALCPTPSKGKIDADIDEVFTGSVNLTPAGIGAEYSASGRISISSEIMTYTLSGDVLTIVERAVDGTEAASHSIGDLAQECYRVEAGTIPDIAADLLGNYAGISSTLLDTANWAVENVTWLAGFELTTTIAKPTGVTQLMGELGLFGVFFWWDEYEQLVKMRANRPPNLGEVPYVINDNSGAVASTLSREELEKQRVTSVIFRHGLRDYSEGLADGNFARALVAKNDGDGPNAYNQQRIATIETRWLGDGNDQIANVVASRICNRFRDPPRQVRFRLDAKDREGVSVAGLLDLTTRVLQDTTGLAAQTVMQVTSTNEDRPGHSLQVTCQSYSFNSRYGFITENGRADYAASTDEEKAKGTYIVDSATLQFGDGTGPYRMF